MDQFGAVWEMICCIRGGGNQYCGTNCILQYWGTLFVIDMYVMLDEFYHQSSGLGLCNPARLVKTAAALKRKVCWIRHIETAEYRHVSPMPCNLFGRQYCSTGDLS